MMRFLCPHALRLLGGLVLAVVLAGLMHPGLASAHALLVQADPGPDSVIARAPAVATFTFSEALNPALTRVRVTDAAGRQVTPETGHLAPSHGGTVWLLPLPRLVPGTYSVFWTSQSATDGHVRSSFYTFRVALPGGTASAGAVGAPPATGAGFGAILDAGSAVTALFTWLGFLGQAPWLGALIVEMGVLVPARRASGTAPARLAWVAAPRLC